MANEAIQGHRSSHRVKIMSLLCICNLVLKLIYIYIFYALETQWELIIHIKPINTKYNQ